MAHNIIPALGSPRREDREFEASLGCAVRPSLKENYKLASVVMHTFDPGIREAETVRDLDEFKDSKDHVERPCLKEGKQNLKPTIQKPVLFSAWNPLNTWLEQVKASVSLSFVGALLLGQLFEDEQLCTVLWIVDLVLAWLSNVHTNLTITMIESKVRTLQALPRASPKSSSRAGSHKVWGIAHTGLSHIEVFFFINLSISFSFFIPFISLPFDNYHLIISKRAESIDYAEKLPCVASLGCTL